ncbi:unnamed protein product [Arctogadus glacialis]
MNHVPFGVESGKRNRAKKQAKKEEKEQGHREAELPQLTPHEGGPPRHRGPTNPVVPRTSPEAAIGRGSIKASSKGEPGKTLRHPRLPDRRTARGPP